MGGWDVDVGLRARLSSFQLEGEEMGGCPRCGVGENEGIIRGESEGRDSAAEFVGESGDGFAGLGRVPKVDGAEAAGGESLSVGGPCDGLDGVFVSRKRRGGFGFVGVGEIVELDGGAASSGESLGIGREGEGEDGLVTEGEGGELNVAGGRLCLQLCPEDVVPGSAGVDPLFEGDDFAGGELGLGRHVRVGLRVEALGKEGL